MGISAMRAGLAALLVGGSILFAGTLPRGGDRVEDLDQVMQAPSALAEEEVLDSGEREDLVFAVFAGDEEQLGHAVLLAESIRTFAGRYGDRPIWIYVPPEGIELSGDLRARLSALQAELCTSKAPAEALWFYYAPKVFAAARAEARAEDEGAILAWLDEDTVVLQEPRAFALDARRVLAYRSVMHRNIGSLFSRPVDDFWARIYRRLAVPDSALFPMITPAYGDTVRPYFNAGLLVVRPERGILRRWAEDFAILYNDSSLVQQCRQDVTKRIFLHQTALVGAILNLADRDEMVELSRWYNYPLFFREMYGASRAFDTIDRVVTLRYDVYFRDPAPDWPERLKGPPDTIDWLAGRLGR